MGPKSKSPSKTAKTSSAKSMEEMQEEMLAKLSILTDKISELEATLKATASENEKLHQQLASQADEIAHLRDSLNEREQYARSWSMRVLNIQIPPGQESNTPAVMGAVYQQLLLPILKGAVESKEIQDYPSCDALLENAHILPGKGSTKPVIVRFYSRYWRSIILRHRKSSAPREELNNTTTRRGAEGGRERSGRMLFPFFEDLTRATFKQLQSIKSTEGVVAVWSVSGIIKFKLADDEQIYKVSSLFDTVDSLTQ